MPGRSRPAAFLAALSGFRPLVSMSWGSDLLQGCGPQAALTAGSHAIPCARSTVLVGDCQAVRDKAASFGFPAAKSFIFPWGIDLERFSPGEAAGGNGADSSARARLGWQDNFVVLSLRSWEPVYGVDVMLRGFARGGHSRTPTCACSCWAAARRPAWSTRSSRRTACRTRFTWAGR